MIQVEGPGGVVIEFPEGTAPEKIKAAMAKQFGGPSAPPAPSAKQPTQSYGDGLLAYGGRMFDAFTQGAAMGFGDELTGLESAILGRKPGGGMLDVGNYDAPFWDRYQRAVDAERGQNDQFSETNPVSAGIAEVVGALATGGAAARSGLTLMGGKSLPPVRAAALEGAGYGALYGAGEADGGDRLEGAAYGGAVGGVTGGAIAGIAQQFAKIRGGRRAARMAPSTQSLKGQASAAYDRARAVNPTFDGFDQFAKQAYDVMADQGYNVRFHPQLATVMDDIEQISRGGTAPDLKTLEQLRRRFEAAAGANTTNADQARLARMGKRALDKFMEQTAAGTNVTAATRTPQQQALADVVEGRALYSRSKKGELIDRMFEMGEDRAATGGSGSNVENAIRQNMRKILDNPKLSRAFTKDEIAAIRTVARGERVQNALRGFGALSPLRGGLMSLLSGGMGGAGVATGNPLMMALPASAAVADALARRGTMSQAQAVSSMVRGGPNAAAVINQSRQISPQMQAIIRAMSAQGGAVTQP